MYRDATKLSIMKILLFQLCLYVHKLQMFYTHVNVCRSMSHTGTHLYACKHI